MGVNDIFLHRKKYKHVLLSDYIGKMTLKREVFNRGGVFAVNTTVFEIGKIYNEEMLLELLMEPDPTMF